jgi:hypothetical protein
MTSFSEVLKSLQARVATLEADSSSIKAALQASRRRCRQSGGALRRVSSRVWLALDDEGVAPGSTHGIKVVVPHLRLAEVVRELLLGWAQYIYIYTQGVH